MTNPCLPRCYWPLMASVPCDMPDVPICCIQWTLPGCTEETFTFDVKNLFSGDSGEWPCVGCADYPGLCGTSQEGSTAFFYTNHGPYFGSPTSYSLLYSCSGNIVEPSTVARANVAGLSPVVVPPENCIPAYLDLPELPDGAFYAACFPYLRWNCIGVDSATEVEFEAGWQIITEVIDAVMTPTYGFCYLLPVARGTAPVDWYTGGSPTPFTLEALEEGYPDAEVQPLVCNYFPCGDPLDCFASCISGTKDCDGTTPAHAPVIYFTIGILGCCLSGTYALTWNGEGGTLSGVPYGAGYFLDPIKTCSDPFATYTLQVILSCSPASGEGGPNGPGDGAFLTIRITNSLLGVTHTYGALVFLSCTGGTLNETTGSFTGCDCGIIGDGDWAIHG